MTRPQRLARALWNEFRREVQVGGSVPPYQTYADGAQEPCEWEHQSLALQRYWLTQARRLLRAAKL